jgi:hypothetical protein
MSRKRHKPEEIVAKLRPVDVLTAQGTPVADAVRSIGVTEVASGRVAGWGDLLLTPRGADRHRELATSLQHGPPACFSGLPATGPGGVRASLRRMAGCATPTGSAGHAPGGAQTDHELTFKPDHPRGADQSRSAVISIAGLLALDGRAGDVWARGRNGSLVAQLSIGSSSPDKAAAIANFYQAITARVFVPFVRQRCSALWSRMCADMGQPRARSQPSSLA